MNKVLVETSARHLHVSEADLETLFGKGHKLTPKKDLSQPGQYASEERVTIVGAKREIPNVTILGPTRPATQVEISMTDARSIGVAPPVRESGHLEASAPVKIVGPAGTVELTEGCIIAKRHVHLDPITAEKFNVENSEIVSVACCGECERRMIFDDVVIRVSDKFSPAMHIDTDESNAAGAPVEGEIIKAK